MENATDDGWTDANPYVITSPSGSVQATVCKLRDTVLLSSTDTTVGKFVNMGASLIIYNWNN